MAEAGSKWPGPVTFDDEEPKGCARISLSIPKLTVTRALPLVGKAEPKNGTVEDSYKKDSVKVRVTVTEDGEDTVYEYNKGLPEDIDTEKSHCKVKKGQVLVILKKMEEVSWGAHAKYLIKKE